MIIASKTFTLDDQRAFAAVSGDRNPMHLDPLFARRTQAGEPVVHGIHGALWALDAAAVAGVVPEGDWLIRFEAFLYLEEEVVVDVDSVDGAHTIVLKSGGKRVTSISSAPAGLKSQVSVGDVQDVPSRPLDLSFDHAASAGGAMRLPAADDDFAAVFPALAVKIGSRRVRAIAGLSTLVGMRLPGLHSIFSNCHISVVPLDETDDEVLAYQVKRARPLLRQLSIECSGGGLGASIDAFVRHPPIRQPALSELVETASGLDLRGEHVLVVGGSRGLGELTAKLAATCGAKVTVTYMRGREDAEAVVEELSASGHLCTAMPLDVTTSHFSELGDTAYTQVYYYPTPQIFRRSATVFSSARFDTFVEIYCHAFFRLCAALTRDRAVKVFWPSTTAIDEDVPGSTEYVMAKLAGEALCRKLEQDNPKLTVLVERLPRLPTDQTSSVIPFKTEDPVTLLRSVMGRMAGRP